MKITTYIIDTFTSKAFKGNPTAVCLVDERLEAELMLSIAKELNLPVTAFIQPLYAVGEYDIRYFTPTTEIPACGHATLASARVALINDNNKRATFFTVNNVAISTRSDDDITTMTYPKYEMKDVVVSKEILESLNIKEYRTAGFCSELETLFIEVENATVLKDIKPDFAQLTKSSDEIKEVVITSEADIERYDYFLRSFCPWIGIDEDPVTGSVHSALAGFWKKRIGRENMFAYQASERGGEFCVIAYDDDTANNVTEFKDKVIIVGMSVIVLKGEIFV